MAELGSNTEEDLQLLDIRIKQLKHEYEGYFIGNRKREPRMLRGEVQKIVSLYANLPIKNTGLRFKFNNLRARYFSFKLEEGRYERHLFKADLKDRDRAAGRPTKGGNAREAGDGDLFSAYVSAREACGQSAKGVTPDKLQALLAKQEAAIRTKYDCASVKFRVVVEDGKAKLKAAPVKT